MRKYYLYSGTKSTPMKHFILLVSLLMAAFSYGQFNQDAPWVKELNSSKNTDVTARQSKQPFTLYELSKSFENHWENKDYNEKGSGFKPFKRWENFWRHFVNEQGYLPTAKELWKTWENKRNSTLKSNPASNWEAVGPFTHLAEGSRLPGQGRVNTIAVDPNNADIWYVGAPAGGIWKSTNAGTSWTPLTDELPQIGVSGIAIDSNNSNVIYITTGDDDAGDSFSVGVFKSTDGGQTWQQTGLNPSNSPSSMNEIYMDPNNSNVLWVATSNGLYKTTDAGQTWLQKINDPNSFNRNVKDLKLKPGNSNVIYVVTENTFYKSTDGGENFIKISEGLPESSGRLVLGVTPADPEYVYILSAKEASDDYAFQGLYKSINSGDTFTKTAETDDIFEIDQAWYDLALEVSPTNAEEIYTGCLNIWKSTNGGNNFSKINSWAAKTPSYTHADIHILRFFNQTLFCGSDGGIYSSANGGASFTDHTAGLAISQFYRISVAPKNANKIIGGLQDNGGHSYMNNQWRNYHGGDGMDNVINPNDDSLIYGFTQFGGSLNISANGGQDLIASIEAPPDIKGEWITPLATDLNGEIYAGYNALYRLSGNSWQKVSTNDFPDNATDLETDPAHAEILYVSVDISDNSGRILRSELLKSTDSGTTFTKIHEFETRINSIEVNNSNSNIVYVTTAVLGKRGVFRSEDGGNNFENISYNLPGDQPYFIVVHQGRHTKNPLYVGTNLGVYRLDDTANEWEEYLTGLPNSPVRDLDISLDQGIITAATYGRGVWQSPIPVEQASDDVALVSIVSPLRNQVFCGVVTPEIIISNNGTNTITSVDITYTINEVAHNFNWTGTLPSNANQNIQLPQVSAAVGMVAMDVEVHTTNDAFSDNNKQSITFFVNGEGNPGELNSFETSANDLITYNEGDSRTSEWQRGVPSGVVLKTAASGTRVYATNLSGDHHDQTKSYLVTPCYDFSRIQNPVLKFKMAYELERNWDIVYVEYSVNKGQNWSVLGALGSAPKWYNSNRTNSTSGTDNDCHNCPGAQWTGTNTTLAEYAYDFKANADNGETDLTQAPNVMFRIVFHADQAVHEEGVVIDDLVVEGSLANDEDGDGVADNSDLCPGTPAGTAVDITGCAVFVLNADNFDIVARGESCAVSNNGTIEITAKESFSYTGTLTGSGINITENFTTQASFDKLAAGSYKLCITLAEQPDYIQCFDIQVEEPEDLSVFSRVEDNGQNVRISLAGAEEYFIEWNGTLFTTTQSELSLPLVQSKNELKVTTSKQCQGTHIETIVLSEEVFIYPNPVRNEMLNIRLSGVDHEVYISLYTISGKQLISKKYPVKNGWIELQPERWGSGVYILNIKTNRELHSYKIIKR